MMVNKPNLSFIDNDLWKKARVYGIDRRHFLQLLAAGGAAAVLSSFKYAVMPNDNFHCIIVGSGPVGISTAIRLASMGMKVLILESGKAITEPAGSHFRNQPKYNENPDSYFIDISPFLKPFTTNSDMLPGLAESSIYGGQGVIWTNNCPRTEIHERWNVMSNPQWDKKYIEAEKMLQVEKDSTPDSLTGNNIKEKLRLALQAENRVIKQLPFSGTFSKTNGTYFNAPWDILENSSDKIRSNIQIRSEVNVERIEHSKKSVTAVEVLRANGNKETINTSLFLLAGGAVGTPRLLYHSKIRPDALGKGFSFHALFFGQMVLDPAIAAKDDSNDLPPHLYIPPTENKPWHIQVFRDTFPAPTSEVVDNPHRLLEFQAFLPIELRNENKFLFKNNGEIDVEFSFSDKDKANMKAVEMDINQLALKMGHWRAGGEPAWVPHGTAHLFGTCRMDIPGKKGVTDKYGKVHDFKNLYVASVGLIPTPVAVNPTLTAVTLGLNTANAILRRFLK